MNPKPDRDAATVTQDHRTVGQPDRVGAADRTMAQPGMGPPGAGGDPAGEPTVHQDPGSLLSAAERTIAQGAAAAGSRFRILQLHARGGLGVVYLAEDTELRRRVALKEIQVELAHDPRSRQRFVLEAEITGRLAHPGIVPVHGLGHHDDGRPFYAMRFVEGETLLDAIQRYHKLPQSDRSQRRLALRQLLAHFVAVCNAVAYAHSEGVIHRDLKPSNVLLGKFGETMLVDWGLAKHLGVCQAEPSAIAAASDAAGRGLPLEERTLPLDAATRQGAAIGTPAYMSPEQAAGQWDQVSIASDVFSLGATLYALLTGSAPVPHNDLEQDWLDQPLSAIPAPRRLAPDTAPALDAICRRAMQPEPAARYASAQELALEVEHWLADEPVAAHPEGLLTRAGRWTRRHLPLVSGVSAGILVLGASLAIGVGLLAKANRQISNANTALVNANRQLADANTQILAANQRTLSAVDELFTDVSENPRLLRKEPGTQALRRALLERARDYYERFLRERGDDASLQTETASACFRLGVIREELEPGPGALDLYRRAEAIRVALGHENADADRQFALAVTRNHIGKLLQDMGQPTEALAQFERARIALTQLTATHPDRPQFGREAARVLANIGIVRHMAGHSAAALEHCRDAQRILERLTHEHPTDPEIAWELAATLSTIGALQQIGGKFADATETLTAARSILERLTRAHPDRTEFEQFLARSTNELAIALTRLRRLDEALAIYQQTLQTRERLARENPGVADFPRELAVTHSDIGTLYYAMKRPRDAIDSSRTALAIQKKLAADHPDMVEFQRDLARTHNNLGVFCDELMLRRQALDEFQASKAIKERLARKQPNNPELAAELAKSCQNLARNLTALGYRDSARQALKQCLQIRQTLRDAQPNSQDRLAELVDCRAALADFLNDSSQSAAALSEYAAALNDAQKIAGVMTEPRRRGIERGQAVALSRTGRHDEALAILDRLIQDADDAARPSLTMVRACALVRAGRLEGLEMARAAAQQPNPPAAVLVAGARVFAVGSRSSDRETALALLKSAAAREWFTDPARAIALKSDPDFEKLRTMAGFTEWLRPLIPDDAGEDSTGKPRNDQ